MKRFLLSLAMLAIANYSPAQQNKENRPFEKPKLVVGIVVDQMRYDYLTNFWHRYGEGGFKRMVNEGFTARNHHFNYVPTSTGPGHASVYTGTTPSVHGIIGNDWFDKNLGNTVYCAGDDSVRPVGTNDAAGKMSPHRMITSTITDELRLGTQLRGKVIGIAIKDRGAILPAGHAANAAYWFHGKKEGNWVSSSYYMEQLPKWVQDFNASDAAEKYKTVWNTLYDINTYVESGSDINDFEGKFTGEATASFPHDLPKLWDANGGFDIIRTTPFGNNLTTDFALAAIDGEALGKDADTDFLAISYSSPDYIGHKFGVNSKEVQDNYLRLDKDLERLFNALDQKVGKGEYTVFLTADHGAIHVPAYLQSVKIPAGYFNVSAYKERLNTFLRNEFKTDKLLRYISDDDIFLNHEVLAEIDEDSDDVLETIANEIITYEGIFQVYTSEQLKTQNYTRGLPYLLQNGFNHKRSGDLLVVLTPSVISYNRVGSTHGSGFSYDTHAPLLFFGKGINQGQTSKRTEIPDIAPTISTLLGIAFPSGTTGKPISEVID